MTDRNDDGKYVERISDNDILKVFDAADAPFLTATEVGEALDMT